MLHIDDEVPRGDREGFHIEDKWLALGDSYSAGVGTGDRFTNPRDPDRKCLTTTGSYPKLLELNYLALRQGLEFLSCSGDVIANINEKNSQNRESQLTMMKSIDKSSYKMATLSIGGNDLGFSSIVKSCIVLGTGNCEEALTKAENIAGIGNRGSSLHDEVYQNLRKVYKDILDAAPDDFSLAVTGYARFFANPQGNTACNNGQMQIASWQDFDLPTRPKLPLTESLRTRINNGVDGFNGMIRGATAEIQDVLAGQNSAKRIWFGDINPVFEGHRFCEPGDSSESGWPTFTDKAWCFSSPYRWDISPDGRSLDPRTDDGTGKLELDRRGDAAFCDHPNNQWDCDIGDLVNRDPDMPLNPAEYPQGRSLKDVAFEWTKGHLLKAFHPKTIAYDQITKRIAASFGQNWDGDLRVAISNIHFYVVSGNLLWPMSEMVGLTLGIT